MSDLTIKDILLRTESNGISARTSYECSNLLKSITIVDPVRDINLKFTYSAPLTKASSSGELAYRLLSPVS